MWQEADGTVWLGTHDADELTVQHGISDRAATVEAIKSGAAAAMTHAAHNNTRRHQLSKSAPIWKSAPGSDCARAWQSGKIVGAFFIDGGSRRMSGTKPLRRPISVCTEFSDQ
jgi:hypothetical protein